MNVPSLIRSLTKASLALGVVASLYAGTPGGGMGSSNSNGSMGGNASNGSMGSKSSNEAMSSKMSAGDMLAKNPKLSTSLQGMLAPGTDLQQASKGFKNFGQFVAAVHVSKNLGVPFDQLKAAMVDNKLSLGQAIHKLKPDADALAEAKKGMDQAMKELS